MDFYQVQQWEKLHGDHGYWRTWAEEYKDLGAAFKAMNHQRLTHSDEFRIVKTVVVEKYEDPKRVVIGA